jgi:hypothetical protein
MGGQKEVATIQLAFSQRCHETNGTNCQNVHNGSNLKIRLPTMKRIY